MWSDSIYLAALPLVFGRPVAVWQWDVKDVSVRLMDIFPIASETPASEAPASVPIHVLFRRNADHGVAPAGSRYAAESSSDLHAIPVTLTALSMCAH